MMGGAFIGKDHADFILYKMIPATYLIHILPFHVLEESKSILANQVGINYQEFTKKMEGTFPAVILISLRDNVFNKSFQNPLSTQGVMIFSVLVNLILRNYRYAISI